MIPYLNFRNTGRILEPFRVRDSFTSFYKEFRGQSSRDLIVRGKLQDDPRDRNLAAECTRFGLTCVNAHDFVEAGFNLFADINEEARDSNLGRHNMENIDRRLSRIERTLTTYKDAF